MSLVKVPRLNWKRSFDFIVATTLIVFILFVRVSNTSSYWGFRNEARSKWDRNEFEVRPKWDRSEIEVKSMWNRSEIDVLSKWNPCETHLSAGNQLWLNNICLGSFVCDLWLAIFGLGYWAWTIGIPKQSFRRSAWAFLGNLGYGINIFESMNLECQ